MKKYLLPVFILALIFASSCRQNVLVTQEVPLQQFNNQLTAEEKTGGVMTPEIMWKFRRLGALALSPDGSNVLYTVTDIDLQSEARRTNIFILSTAGGDPIQLTTEGGSSPQWFNNGKSIAFIRTGDLFTMNADGSDQKIVSGLNDFEIFSISPADNKIYFTRRVKLDQTANDKYAFPNAKVRIIDDLMYRHWNTWSDFSYSHIFVASFNGTSVSKEKDIMEGQRFESPTSPYFDESELSWSPDGRAIAYTSKRLKGIDDARSTNSDIYLYDIVSSKELNITDGNRGYDKYPVFSPDGSKIAFQSMERDGYESDLDRLFVYDIKSGRRTRVSEGWDFDVENIAWANDQTIYFTSAYFGTGQIFKTNISESVVEKVTEGIHDMGPLNIKSGVLVAGFVSMSMAREVSVVDMTTGQVKQISFINKAIYESIKMGKVEERYIKTKDNKDLQMWI